MTLLTLREAIRAATERLLHDPELAAQAPRDAEWLLLHRLSLSRADLRAHPEASLTAAQQENYQADIVRRLRHEPIQHILGEQEFFGLALRVSPAVLIPRPETEHLVEAVLARADRDHPIQIVDVGTGSGAIAIALAAHLPLAKITALDISAAALAVAAQNIRTHGLEGRIRLLESDLLAALGSEGFDIVVSNPPYIPEQDRPSLDRQVRDFEPALALFAPENGLGICRRLIPQARAALRPGGLLAMEIGYGQREAVAELLPGWEAVTFVNDLQSIPRVVLATRTRD